MKNNSEDLPATVDSGIGRSAALRRALRCEAEKWRDFGGAKTDSARELLEECLSFVTSAQQGRSVAGRGDPR